MKKVIVIGVLYLINVSALLCVESISHEDLIKWQKKVQNVRQLLKGRYEEMLAPECEKNKSIAGDLQLHIKNELDKEKITGVKRELIVSLFLKD